MNYHVEFTKNAMKQLKKMDRANAALLLGWIRKNLEGCADPRLHGKALSANLSGQWRYRVGDYRLICEIQDDKILILVLNVGHRSEIYNQQSTSAEIILPEKISRKSKTRFQKM